MVAGRRPRPLDPGAGPIARLGHAVREARIGHNLTLGQLAARVDSTLQHLSEIERAKAVPNDQLARELEMALGTNGRQERARARQAACADEDL